MRQVSPVADPLRRNDRELLRQLVQGRCIARSEASELLPGFLRAMASVGRLSQPVAGLIEFAALTDGIVERTVVEIQGQALEQMIPDAGDQLGRAFELVSDRSNA